MNPPELQNIIYFISLSSCCHILRKKPAYFLNMILQAFYEILWLYVFVAQFPIFVACFPKHPKCFLFPASRSEEGELLFLKHALHIF